MATPSDVASGNAVPPATGQPRRWPWRVCAVVAGILLFVANIQVWLYRDVVDTDSFVDTVTTVLHEQDVRDVLAERIVDRLFEGRPLLRIAAGNAVESVVSGLLASDGFEAVLEGVARQFNLALTKGEQPSITIESRVLQAVTVVVAKVLTPDQAADLGFDDGDLVIELFEPGQIPSYESEIDTIHTVGIIAGILALILLALPVVVLRNWWSLRLAGFAVLVGSVITFVAVPGTRTMMDLRVDDPDVETMLEHIYDAFTRQLAIQAVVLLVISACLFAGAWIWELRADDDTPQSSAAQSEAAR